jgi:hypothetical protein
VSPHYILDVLTASLSGLLDTAAFSIVPGGIAYEAPTLAPEETLDEVVELVWRALSTHPEVEVMGEWASAETNSCGFMVVASALAHV